MSRRRKDGRRKGDGQHYRLTYHMMQSEAFRKLKGGELKVFLELHSRFQVRGDGCTNNNGSITLSQEATATLLGMSKSTVNRALRGLEAKGFIKVAKPGQWYGRKATEFILTDAPFNGMPATNDWQNHGKVEPAKKASKPKMLNVNGHLGWNPARQDWVEAA